jgi:hypothetical protein
MDIQFIGQVPKDEMAPDLIEDCYGLSKNPEVIVLSDGASESYDSRTLSRLICEKFLTFPNPNLAWIESIIYDFSSKVDLTSLSWSKQAAYNRGSFATLLALYQTPSKKTITLFCIGDSFAVLLENGIYKDSFPYKKSKEFSQKPTLISTIRDQNTFIFSPGYPKTHILHWRLSAYRNPTVLCMTDALGQWALKNEEHDTPIWNGLLNISNQIDLVDLVNKEWEKKEMRKDDITFIKVTFPCRGVDELPIA